MPAKLVTKLAIAGATLLFSIALYAHHGAGAYDTSQIVTVTGEVSEFRFINPHVLISAQITGEDGSVVEWSGELTSPNRLARAQGGGVKWHTELLKPGDEVTLTGNPARNGAPFLRLTKVADGSGQVLIGGN